VPTDRILIGQIGAPHGVRGEVRLISHAEEPLDIVRYGALETEEGSRTIEIVCVRRAKHALVARLRGIDDRIAAEKLRHVRLYVARSRLPKTEDADTFYHADLIGLVASTDDGRILGRVTAVQNFGASDILEIKPADGSEPILVPFTTLAVPHLDIGNGRVVVNPPGVVENEADHGRLAPRRRRAAKRSGER